MPTFPPPPSPPASPPTVPPAPLPKTFPFTVASWATTDYGGIKYGILLEGLYAGRFSQTDGQSFTAQVVTEWDKSPFKFLRAMLGSSEVAGSWNGGAISQLSRTQPERFPWTSVNGTDPDADPPTQFFCVECNPKGVFGNGIDPTAETFDKQFTKPQPDADVGQWPHPKWVVYDCTFAALPYFCYSDDEMEDLGFVTPDGRFDETQRNCITDDSPHEELERTRPGQYWLDTGGMAIALNEVPAIRAGHIRREVQWLGLPQEMPMEALKGCAAKVNTQTFMGYPPGKVLFSTYGRKRKTNVFGLPAWDYVYTFLIRNDERTWNQFRLPTGGGGLAEAKILLNGQPATPIWGDKFFLSEDLHKLFQFD